MQVLDDSTDASVRAAVDAAAAGWRLAGVPCYVLRREERVGYKAGALEVGRKQTKAEFLASARRLTPRAPWLPLKRPLILLRACRLCMSANRCSLPATRLGVHVPSAHRAPPCRSV